MDWYNYILFFSIILLLFISGFFSGSETGMMALNRYKLKSAVRKNNHTAIKVNDLLACPDRLLRVILLGNTFKFLSLSKISIKIK